MLRVVTRVVLAVLALGLLGLGCFYFDLGRDMNRQFRAALDAEPVRIRVDLSKAGKYEGTFAQTYSRSHGEEILLRADPPFNSKDEAAAALAGLSFRIRVLNDAGENVVGKEGAYEIRPAVAVSALEYDVPLADLHSFRKGRYKFQLDVLKPAPGVAGRAQEVFARYECCMWEREVASVMQGLGIAAIILSLLAGGLAWWLRPRAPRPKT